MLVQHHDVDAMFRQLLDGIHTVLGQYDLKALLLETLLAVHADAAFVVCDQDRFHRPTWLLCVKVLGCVTKMWQRRLRQLTCHIATETQPAMFQQVKATAAGIVRRDPLSFSPPRGEK